MNRRDRAEQLLQLVADKIMNELLLSDPEVKEEEFVLKDKAPVQTGILRFKGYVD